MKPYHTAVGLPPYGPTAYYVNATGASDPAPFPDGSVWVGEGQYKCSCGCLLGLPVLNGIEAHPNQFTVTQTRPKPPQDEEDRDDYAGGCLEPPCEGSGGGGGGTGGLTSYFDTLDSQTGQTQGGSELHIVCDVTDYYIDGDFSYTQVHNCWYELHQPHG
jgi:hypothetical protein